MLVYNYIIKSSKNMTNQNYKPGVCNINKIEVKKRLMTSLVAFIVFLIGLIYLLFYVNYKPIRFILIVPLFIGILGLFQSQQKFCVFYGLTSQENSDDKSLTPKKISNLKNRLLDQKKSKKIILFSLIISLVIMALINLIPTLQ